MIFCGIFDGHGPWGHYVAKAVRKSLPACLLCNWQEALALVADEKLCQFDIWKQSYLRTCATVDKELEHHRSLDSYHSGTTALTIVKQVITNCTSMYHTQLVYSYYEAVCWSVLPHVLVYIYLFVNYMPALDFLV